MNLIRNSILKLFPFLRNIKKIFHPYIYPNSNPILLRRMDLSNLPYLNDISPLFIKEIKNFENSQIDEWLNIINQAFSRKWREEDYINNIVNHPIYNIEYTYFLMDGEKPIGVVSEASFRLKKNMGVTHYLALKHEYSGRGLGKYLILFTLHKMKEHNFQSCEVETNLKHKESIKIHSDFGFEIQLKSNLWNTPRSTPIIMNIFSYLRFRNLIKKWRLSRDLEK